MKTFLSNLWAVIVKILKWVWSGIKWLWVKLITFLRKFNYVIKLVFKGIEGDNQPGNKYWILVPTPYGRVVNKTLEIGIVWLGTGIKLVISKK